MQGEVWTEQEDRVLLTGYGVRPLWRVRKGLPERSALEVFERAAQLGVAERPGEMRRCSKCKCVRPLEEFSKSQTKPRGRSYHCLPCHRARDAAYQRARRATRKAAAPVKVEPAYAVPRMDLCEQLACVQLRKWRGPVNDGPLVATIRPRLAA